MQRRTTFAALLALTVAALPGRVVAQQRDTTGEGDRRFLRPTELALLGGGIAASGVLSIFDTRIARWTQSSGVQGDSSRRRLVERITKVNESTLTLAGLVFYGVGRISNNEMITDVAKHTTEAVVITSLISQAMRGPLGRTRPYVTHDSDQYNFQAGKGFTKFDNRSWPSLHSATAFAAGSALVAEIRERHPDALPWAAPLIFGAAALPGLSRMYLDQHWASDVLAGDIIGAVIGGRIVKYAHSAKPGDGPGWLVNATVSPSSEGGVVLGVSLQP